VSALHRFEQRLEHLVTGAFARAFRSAVQPMEIAAALQREVDNSAQILSRERRLAPNDFLIDLSPTDFDRLSAYGETLSGELAQMLHEHADEQRYLFAGAIQLRFQRSDELTTGRFRVRSSAAADVTPSPGQPMTDTAVRRAAVTLELNGVRHPLEPPGLVIGRGSQADLRIDDPGVSRRHAEFRVRPGPDGTLVTVVDLGSTNGTLVDGRRVQHAILDDGAVVQLGGTTIHVHLTGTAPPQHPPSHVQASYPTYPPDPQSSAQHDNLPPAWRAPETEGPAAGPRGW
jgi:Protein of unknown function (DUF3662)/FHA domain